MTEQELQQIDAAKAALEIWQRFENSDISTMSDAEIKICVERREIIHNSANSLVRRVIELEDENKYLKDQLREYELALAGSDALVLSHEGHIAKLEGWQARALPWLEEMRLHVSLDPAHYDHELARLDAIIARAKPEEVER